MSENADNSDSGLNIYQRFMLDEFCSSQSPSTPQEQAFLEQAAAELRDQLKEMGLVIETEEQFYAACIVSIATASNITKLTSKGLQGNIAEQASNKVIAALRPQAP